MNEVKPLHAPRLFASRRDWAEGVAVAGLLGYALAFFFLPTVLRAVTWIWEASGQPQTWNPQSVFWFAFPVAAFFFFTSLPGKQSPAKLSKHEAWGFAWRSSLLPFAIAIVHGWFNPAPVPKAAWLWIFVAIPIGEECLFRGWMYTLLDRLSQGRYATASNPLPLAVWLSSAAFALWHLQNLPSEPPLWVAWEIAYSGFAGVWLALLRWYSGSLWPPILAHALLNVGTALV